MFAARCVGILLALFVLLYVPASLAVSQAWAWLWQLFTPRTARGSATLLFALRILPFGLASVFTLAFTLPSFLLLEPRSSGEAVGLAPVVLGLCCVALLAAGMAQAVRAQVRTSRALMRWLDGSTILDSNSPLPVLLTVKDAPSLTVAGVREPKVLVSEAAVAALTPAELAVALKHEIAHAQSYDNLKKLLFRFSAFPGMAALERAWAEQGELAADDAAVSSSRDALDLAGALIKVSRLKTSPPQAILATGLLHTSTALGERIQRLVVWERSLVSSEGKQYRYAAATAGALCVVIATYGSVLTGLHQLTEWLVR